MKEIYLFILCFLFASCRTDNAEVQPAFYHWKQDFNPGKFEYNRLQELRANRLYIRFFDVDRQDGIAVPLSIVNFQNELSDSLEVVPVVFVTNRTLLEADETEVKDLAQRILKKIDEISAPLAQRIPEIQIDCDWSGQTREGYFLLLKQMRTVLDKKGIDLSATIRLHQIKFFKRTGVPEVDRGVLMFYNTGAVDDPATENSILDLSTAQAYFENFREYPLPLDLALPIFRWGVVFQEGRFVRLINGLDKSALRDTARFAKVGENQFELLKSTYLEGYYLYKGDRVRTERVSQETLLRAAELLSDEMKAEDRHLIFYHLDSTLIADYPHEILETVYRTFD